ncbi:DUF1622 domain-containing protein [Citrobacter portucalensis]|uniref:DUF1622 domain-containing protein n=1 Tax=Citrobacter portucalensis TaxID=1639133 RepID=UPI003C2B2475
MEIIFFKQLMMQCVTFLQFVTETMSVLCILIGLIRTSYVIVFYGRKQCASVRVRLCLGGWLAVALEFQLASDILATTVSPTMDELIKLAIIAVIRTFLNYFLSKELEAQPKSMMNAEDKTQ